MLESEKEPFNWGFEAGFLRSPVNPRMLLLNRTPEIDCDSDGNASGNASAWSLVSIANDLLRVDLSSLFNEIGDKYSERANQRFYIDLQNAIRQSPAAPHHAQHASMDRAAEPDHDDWLDPDDSNQESAQAELNEAEVEASLQKQKERDLDFFASIFDKAITRHAHGEISGMARYLLENVCRQCVMNITAIPDYRYYSCWMNNNAIECNEINRLYRAVITTSGQLNKQEMASLFSSYLQLKSNDMIIKTANGETDLTAPAPYDRDNPIYSFPKAKSQIETACVCTNTNLFRALLIVFYQECLELAPLLKSTEAPSLLAQNEEFFPAAIKTSDPRQFRLFDERLPAIIRFGDAFACAAKKHLPGNETAQKLEEHLSDIKRMNSAPFMQAFRNNHLEAMRENHIFANGDFHTYAEINDQENLNRLVRLQAVIAKAGELYFTEKEWSFASLYARILHELLLCGIMPITCQTCGSLFFPTGPNSKYCDRYNAKTKLYCNPRFNAKKHLGRKSPRDVALNIRRKADTAYSKGLTDCAHYFDHLSNFVLDGLGPAYQASSLISDELYAAWLSIVNQPNCKSEIRRPDRNDFPYSVLWYGHIVDGNRYTQIDFLEAEYPALFERLNCLVSNPRPRCRLDYLEPIEHPYSSWYVRLHELLEIITQLNATAQNSKPIPLLGIDGPEYVLCGVEAKTARGQHDSHVYSTGTVRGINLTVYEKWYEPATCGQP